MSRLQLRARRFLERPFPLGNYAEGNLTDAFIRRYIDEGPWEDPELHDLLRLCYLEAQNSAQEHTGEARAYFEECTEILHDILVDVYGDTA